MEAHDEMEKWTLSPESNLRDKARELMNLAVSYLEPRDILQQLSQGFEELSELAKACRKNRVSCAAHAMATIFHRPWESNHEDLPFVIDTAANFLDTLQAPDVFAMKKVNA